MGMFAWTLMSLIAYLESLLGQGSTILAPQAILTPGMHETQSFSNLLVRFNLVGLPTRSLVMLILPHTCNHLKSLEPTYPKN